MGKRVVLDNVKIERSIEFTEAIASADGMRFSILMGPDQTWTGVARKTFTIMGSTAVAIHGPTTMAQLLLESDDACTKSGGQ